MIETFLRDKGIRRVLGLVLVLAMCISLMSSTVFAAETLNTMFGCVVCK